MSPGSERDDSTWKALVALGVLSAAVGAAVVAAAWFGATGPDRAGLYVLGLPIGVILLIAGLVQWLRTRKRT